MGHHGVAAAHARKAGGLREAAYLYRHALGARYLVDGVGNIGVSDVCLVSSVEHDERIVLKRIVNPPFQFGAGERGTGGVVGVAEVNEVGTAAGQIGHEAVFSRGGQVSDATPAAVGTGFTGTARHHVGINVDGVDGVSHGDGGGGVEQLADVGSVALGTVAHKHFVGREVHAQRGEVMADDGLTQEAVALFGTVAVESVGRCQLVDGAVHRLDGGGGQGASHVADAQTDEPAAGVLRKVLVYAVCYFRKKVTR